MFPALLYFAIAYCTILVPLLYSKCAYTLNLNLVRALLYLSLLLIRYFFYSRLFLLLLLCSFYYYYYHLFVERVAFSGRTSLRHTGGARVGSAPTKHLILSASYKAGRAMAPCQRPRLLLPMLLLLQNITNVVRTTAVNPSPAALPSFVADPPHASPGAGTKPFAGFTTARAWGSADARLATLEFLYVAVADVVKGPRPGADDDWESVFEPALRAAAAKSRHIIVRFYLDYPKKSIGSSRVPAERRATHGLVH